MLQEILLFVGKGRFLKHTLLTTSPLTSAWILSAVFQEYLISILYTSDVWDIISRLTTPPLYFDANLNIKYFSILHFISKCLKYCFIVLNIVTLL